MRLIEQSFKDLEFVLSQGHKSFNCEWLEDTKAQALIMPRSGIHLYDNGLIAAYTSAAFGKAIDVKRIQILIEKINKRIELYLRIKHRTTLESAEIVILMEPPKRDRRYRYLSAILEFKLTPDGWVLARARRVNRTIGVNADFYIKGKIAA